MKQMLGVNYRLLSFVVRPHAAIDPSNRVNRVFANLSDDISRAIRLEVLSEIFSTTWNDVLGDKE